MSPSLPARIALLVVLALLPSLAMAQQAPSIDQMFSNFGSSSVALMTLVRWMALPVGLFISFKALLSLKEYAEAGSRTRLSTPIGLALVGAFLILFPWATNVATQTIALGSATGTQLSRVPAGGGAPGVQAALEGVMLFVKLVGHIAFFRGFLLLKGVAEGNQQATIGRALTHIFGGAAAINIGATVNMLANTFAPGMLTNGF